MDKNVVVLVAGVTICCDSKVLMIKENKPAALNKWNFPSGRIEHKENIRAAARREVFEETGYDVRLTGTTGVYNFISSTNNQVILFHFTGEIIGGSLRLEEEEIIDSKWISLEELIKLEDEQLREASVLKQIAARLIDKEIHPLDIFHEQLTDNK